MSKGGQQQTSGSQNTNMTTTPIVPSQWQNTYNQTGAAMGNTGLTTSQQGAVNNLNQVGQGFNYYSTAGTPTLTYTPSTTAAQIAPVGNVASKNFTDYDFSQYADPYLSSVIAPVQQSLADSTAQQMNAADVMRPTGSFGGARQGVADALLGGQIANQSAQTLAGLYQNAYDTASGNIESDANRQLSADQSNQSTQAAIAQAQAQLAQQNSQANANLLNANNQFNVNALFQGDQQRLGALGSEAGIDSSVLGAGNTGLSQIQNWLTTGIPTFGSNQVGTGTSSSTTTNNPGLFDWAGLALLAS